MLESRGGKKGERSGYTSSGVLERNSILIRRFRTDLSSNQPVEVIYWASLEKLVGEKDPIYWNFETVSSREFLLEAKLSGLLSRNRVVSRDVEREQVLAQSIFREGSIEFKRCFFTFVYFLEHWTSLRKVISKYRENMRQISKRRFIPDNFKDRYDRNNLVKVPRETLKKRWNLYWRHLEPFDNSIEIWNSRSRIFSLIRSIEISKKDSK